MSSPELCEQLLWHLDMSNVLFWGEALSTVRAIVGGVDYKVSHSLPLPACTSTRARNAASRDFPDPDLDFNDVVWE